MQLSPHFAREEFESTVPMPDAAAETYSHLCVEVLEPVRDKFNFPLTITSGYRSPESNRNAHGQPNSEHMATENWCAADFKIEQLNGDMRPVFDWMRGNPNLPYHQLILEHEASGHTIVHVSYNRLKIGVRSCKEGSVNNLTPYVDVVVVAYEPPAQEGVQA